MNLIYPVFTLIILHFIVLTFMFKIRVNEMKANKIHPERLKLRSQSGQELKDSSAADNFMNLFEMPIVFYVVTILAIVLGKYTVVTVVLSWLFVFSRYLHSYIHCTYNKVMDRFKAFAFSNLVLFVLFLNVFYNVIGQ